MGYGFTDTRSNRHPEFTRSHEAQRQAESSGYIGKGKESRTREILPTFSGVTVSSSRLSALSGRGSQLGGNLLDSPPTDMPQEIPRVFSQHPRSLLFSLGQSFSPLPSFLSLFQPLLFAFQCATRVFPAFLFHCAYDVAFLDLFKLCGPLKPEIPTDCQSFM